MVVVAMAKKTKLVVRERGKEKGANHPDAMEDRGAAGRMGGKGGGGRARGGERSAHSVTLTGKPY